MKLLSDILSKNDFDTKANPCSSTRKQPNNLDIMSVRNTRIYENLHRTKNTQDHHTTPHHRYVTLPFSSQLVYQTAAQEINQPGALDVPL